MRGSTAPAGPLFKYLTMDLFESSSQSKIKSHEPLAVRMRPTSLKEFVGQQHILGPGKLLSRAIIADTISSIVFYGPPGTGKTTLATVISNETKSFYEPMNAVTSNVAEIRKAIDQAKKRFEMKRQKPFFLLMRSIGLIRPSRMC